MASSRIAAFTRFVLFLSSAAVFLSCGGDENELTRDVFYTGLWRMETSSSDIFHVELAQGESDLDGTVYLERGGDLGDPIPIANAILDGGGASFDIDIDAIPEDDPIRRLPAVAIRECSVVIADSTLDVGKRSARRAAPAERSPADGPAKNTERLSIDASNPPCPLDTIWVGADSTVFEDVRFRASGGTPPYTWEASGLPFGLSIDAESGVIRGTPADIIGEFPFTVAVADDSRLESFHVEASLENPDLLRMTITLCSPDTCYTIETFSRRESAGF